MVIKIVCYSSIPKYPLDVPVLSTQKYPENSHVGSGGGGRLASEKTTDVGPLSHVAAFQTGGHDSPPRCQERDSKRLGFS